MAAGLPVVCVETRHMMALLKAQQINKSDRNDARGIAQMMRVGLFKPVHVKTQMAQEQRMLLTSRKLCKRSFSTSNATYVARFATSDSKSASWLLENSKHGSANWSRALPGSR